MVTPVAPRSVPGLQRRDVVFKPFNDARLSAPILMHVQADDESVCIRSLLEQLYALYRAEGIPHYEESL